MIGCTYLVIGFRKRCTSRSYLLVLLSFSSQPWRVETDTDRFYLRNTNILYTFVRPEWWSRIVSYLACLTRP